MISNKKSFVDIDNRQRSRRQEELTSKCLWIVLAIPSSEPTKYRAATSKAYRENDVPKNKNNLIEKGHTLVGDLYTKL